ncbi:conserved protein, unknown function, partial [Hepatocystis sp. ex Piliocolobus tephrosceles]
FVPFEMENLISKLIHYNIRDKEIITKNKKKLYKQQYEHARVPTTIKNDNNGNKINENCEDCNHDYDYDYDNDYDHDYDHISNKNGQLGLETNEKINDDKYIACDNEPMKKKQCEQNPIGVNTRIALNLNINVNDSIDKSVDADIEVGVTGTEMGKVTTTEYNDNLYDSYKEIGEPNSNIIGTTTSNALKLQQMYRSDKKKKEDSFSHNSYNYGDNQINEKNKIKKERNVTENHLNNGKENIKDMNSTTDITVKNDTNGINNMKHINNVRSVKANWKEKSDLDVLKIYIQHKSIDKICYFVNSRYIDISFNMFKVLKGEKKLIYSTYMNKEKE